MQIELNIEDVNILLQSCKIHKLTLITNLNEDKYSDMTERAIARLWIECTDKMIDRLEKIKETILKGE